MKTLQLVLIITLVTFGLSAKNSISGVWIDQVSRNGGGVEFGFPLYHNENWLIRNHISINGYGYHTEESYGQITLEEKLLFGGDIPVNAITIKPYGFISSGLGIINWDSYVMDLSMGGGFEYQFSTDISFFIEYGGAVTFALDSSEVPENGGTILSIGYRNYF